jgi:hypothetical protein
MGLGRRTWAFPSKPSKVTDLIQDQYLISIGLVQNPVKASLDQDDIIQAGLSLASKERTLLTDTATIRSTRH